MKIIKPNANLVRMGNLLHQQEVFLQARVPLVQLAPLRLCLHLSLVQRALRANIVQVSQPIQVILAQIVVQGNTLMMMVLTQIIIGLNQAAKIVQSKKNLTRPETSVFLVPKENIKTKRVTVLVKFAQLDGSLVRLTLA